MATEYDLVVIGGGSAGLTAAEFGTKLGAKVALVEKARIGGDCTWTGCIPSKALLKVAKTAHIARTAEQYGVHAPPVRIDMPAVQAYVQQAVESVYARETPEILAGTGVEVLTGAAQFLDARQILIGERTISARYAVICTGAHPRVPAIDGIESVEYMTYAQVFEQESLPHRLAVVGAGPVGVEMAQAHARLGAEVTLIGPALLPHDEPEAQEALSRVLLDEGVCFLAGRVERVERINGEVILGTTNAEVQCDRWLLAAGRRPNVDGMALDAAGIVYDEEGIRVDSYLRTNIKHIFAAGDCTGGHQFTHYAGWQGFQAARNALLPSQSEGVSESVPWTTYTDPEVARAGLSETQARERHGDKVCVTLRPLDEVDRGVCENDLTGFIKIVHMPDGTVLGATIVAARAGEMITEFVLAIEHGLKLKDLAEAMHVYPTYGMAVQRMATDHAVAAFLRSRTGRILRTLSGL